MFSYWTAHLWHPKIIILTKKWFLIQIFSFSFPMFMIFSFLLIHAAWLSNSLFSVCSHVHAFADIILHFMEVRRNCKLFPFCVKVAAISCLFTCVRALCIWMLMHMLVCVCTCIACWCVYVWNIHTSNFLRPPIPHFFYFNTSIDYGCIFEFLMCLYLREMYIHSACTFKLLCL